MQRLVLATVLLLSVVFIANCTEIPEISGAPRSGLCNDPGAACCGDTKPFCDPSQGLGCTIATRTCVVLQNSGDCNDPGETCCDSRCAAATHMHCGARNTCVPPADTVGDCGDFGERSCANDAGARQCVTPGQQDSSSDGLSNRCVWSDFAGHVNYLGVACYSDVDCVDNTKFECDMTFGSCVLVPNIP